MIRKTHLQKFFVLGLVVTLVSIGGYWLMRASNAATSVVGQEAESATPRSPATVLGDGSASGGSALKFGAGAAWLAKSSTMPWQPPTLAANHRVVRVNDDISTRMIQLKDGEDCLVIMPSKPVSAFVAGGANDALITVYGGRNVVVIGGHIQAQKIRSATLVQAVADASGMTFTVDSTAGFPPSGRFRIDGEYVKYRSLDATHFYADKRNAGYYNNSPISSNTSHAMGAKIYIGEDNRSGMLFGYQTGTVHIEGLRIDGFINDGLRFSGGKATVQIQNTRIGPNTNYELQYQTDGHPDDIQVYGGAAEMRLAKVSLLSGPNGNTFLNKNDSANPSVKKWTMRDTEFVSPDGLARSLFVDADPNTTYDVQSTWMRYPSNQKFVHNYANRVLAARFTTVPYQTGQPDVVTADNVGIGYVSPGYDN